MEDFTKYEVARILGARALQISMDAPLLLDVSQKKVEKWNYDPLKLAELEFKAEVLPITIKRPLPKKRKEKLKREEEKKVKDKELVEKEMKEEKEIKESGEIMEIAKPADEQEEAAKKAEPAA